MITRSLKTTKTRKKRDFLNAAQKKQLKNMLIEKFTKLYGLANPKAVRETVEKFFKSKKNVNSKNLLKLEEQVKKEALRYKSKTTKPEQKKTGQITETVPQEVVESQIEQEGQQQKFEPRNEDDSDCTGNESQAENWDTIGMYQAYITKQEKELEKQKKKLKQKALKSLLDNQIKDKSLKKTKFSQEIESYATAEQIMQQKYLEKEQERESELEKNKQKLMEMQKRIIKEKENRVELKRLKEQQADEQIMKCIKDDLAKQKQIQIIRHQEKLKEMRKIKEENESRKKLKLEQEKKDKKEEIHLQNLAIKLQLELEQRRVEEMNRKSEKIQKIMIIGEKVVKKQKDKNLEEEKRINKYIRRRNREMKRRQKRLEKEKETNKVKYKHFLDEQVKEKNSRLKEERDYIRQQADIWRNDEKLYKEVLKTEKREKIENKLKYREELERQIREKENIEKKKKAFEPNEEEIKAQLIEKIQELEHQKNVLSQQLNY